MVCNICLQICDYKKIRVQKISSQNRCKDLLSKNIGSKSSNNIKGQIALVDMLLVACYLRI